MQPPRIKTQQANQTPAMVDKDKDEAVLGKEVIIKGEADEENV